MHIDQRADMLALRGRYLAIIIYIAALSLVVCDDSKKTLRPVEHTQSVDCLAVSSDSSIMISGSLDQTIKMWNITDATLIRTLIGHSESISSVSISPDSLMIVSGSDDQTIKIWNAKDGTLIRTLIGHAQAVNTVAITPDNSKVVSGSKDSAIRVWDISNELDNTVITGHNGPVNKVLVTSDGTHIVSSSADATVRIWDLRNKILVRTLVGHTISVKRIAITPDDKKIISGDGGAEMFVWNLADGNLENKILKSFSIYNFDVTPDSSNIIVMSKSHIYVCSLLDGTDIKKLGEANGIHDPLAVSPDGIKILAGRSDGTIRVFNQTDGKLISSVIGRKGDINGISFTPGGLIVSGGAGRKVDVWDIANGTIIKSLTGHTDAILSITTSSDGRYAISGGNDRTIKIWDLDLGQMVRSINAHTSRINSIIVTSDDSKIISASEDRTIKVWDTKSGNLLQILRHNSHRGKCLALVHGDTKLISGYSNGRIVLWNLSTGLMVNEMIDSESDLRSLSVHPYDDFFLSSNIQSVITVWSLSKASFISKLKYDTESIFSILFISGGVQFISNHRSNIALWNFDEKKAIHVFFGHDFEIKAMATSKDGKLLASTGVGGMVELMTICGPGSFYNSSSETCAICPTGSYGGPDDYVSCSKCPPGTYGAQNGSASIQNCLPCDMGTFSAEPGQSYCRECPTGTFGSSSSATSCIECPVGYFSQVEGQKTCTPCPFGTYSNKTGSKICEKCPAGFFNTEIGSSSIEKCHPCPPGQYSKGTGQSSCLSCLPGEYNPYFGQQNCMKCGLGTKNPNYGEKTSQSCLECPLGTYGDDSRVSCTSCPAGTYNNISGLYGDSSCIICPDGTYSSDGSATCSLCPSGYYQEEGKTKIMASCLACPKGSYNTKSGAYGMNSCEACPRGTFNDKEGQASCIFCPAGTFHNFTGAIDESSCILCPIGTLSSGGSYTCSPCPARSTTTNRGGKSTSDCSCSDTFVSNNGVCTCKPGEYEYGTSCVPCGLGSYKPTHGTDVCFSCPFKYTTNSTGRTSKDQCQCKDGFSRSGENCECGPGMYETMGNCAECPSNTYNPSQGQTSCINCPPNSETKTTGSKSSSACECKRNSYLDVTSQKCLECPLGFVCDGSSSVNVAPGYWQAPSLEGEYISFTCFYESACNGGNNTCAFGYKGALCSVCEEGFGASGIYCVKCPDQRTSMFLVVISFALPIGFVMFMIEQSRQPKTGSILILKTMASHFQILSSLGSFDLQWSSQLISILKVPALFSFSISVDSYPLECRFDPSVYEKLFYSMMLPVFLIGLVLLIILFKTIWHLIRGTKTKLDLNYYQFRQEFLYSTLVMLFFVHPSITASVANIFSCETLGDKSFLKVDMSIECSDATYLMWRNIAIGFTVFYCVMGPILLLLRMIAKKRALGNPTSSTYSLLRFLVDGYNENCFYWEVVTMMQKMLVVFISVFFSSSLQLYFGLWLLFCSVVSILYVKPFMSNVLKKSQLLSFAGLYFTLMVGLLFRYSDISSTSETVLSVLVAVINGMIAVIFLSKAGPAVIRLVIWNIGDALSYVADLVIENRIGKWFSNTQKSDNQVCKEEKEMTTMEVAGTSESSS